jgi:predicted methyltransferase
MRISLMATMLFLALPAATQAQTTTPATMPVTGAPTPAYVTAAINDPARQADSKDDARRQIAAVVAFAQIKPGDKVVELVPGSGYWTRVFSALVGASGRVYTVWPQEMIGHLAKSYANWQTLAATPHYKNVTLLEEPAEQVSIPQKVDVVFTSQNYHDYHDFPVSIVALDKHIFETLKPGGVFVIIDHVAPAGSGASDTNTLHRIDPMLVKKEVEAAGFVFDDESNALRNPNDPHTAKVFDKSIRGHTDQFVYRFRKPLR